jgi:hypothetical protein
MSIDDWIKEVKVLCDGVTPGPWQVNPKWNLTITCRNKAGLRIDIPHTRFDAKLIAASRSALPKALDLIEQLKQIIKDTCACDVDYECEGCEKLREMGIHD